MRLFVSARPSAEALNHLGAQVARLRVAASELLLVRSNLGGRPRYERIAAWSL
ncbi:hypothetical protein PSH03_004702 [Micromonospora sp. PSH03]|uniref:hypothetical protein n=1 Tax=Micromonospora TaxID=1873 RepID=UPI001B35F18C|nr:MULTISPECIES: hypothetical protein [Micromonospora]MBQ0990503.1 hypothetical protein [Micromonospora sp. H61]MCG5458939.1 hypothetical protein [Micromonospora salmantinae]